MTESDYKSLCEACDYILDDPDLPAACKAVSSLHIIREHPVFLSRYESLFEPKTRSLPLLAVLRNRAGLIKALFRCFRFHKTKCDPRMRAEVLFVSHLINPDHLDNEEDFYFYDLPQKLAKEGIQPVVALIDHVREAYSRPARGFERGGVPAVVLNSHTGCFAALSDIKMLSETAASLRDAAQKEKRPLHRHLIEAAAAECLTAGSLWNLGIAAQIRNLVAVHQPRMIITTYEGHAWERLVFRAAKEERPGIRCAGYQHSSLFRLQHAACRKIGGGCDPDVIFTSGAMSKSFMEASPGLKGVPIHILGSRRGRDRDFADNSRTRITGQVAGRPGCLVIPEGTQSECRILFDFSRRCARLFPGMDFVWRLHPVLSDTGFLENDPVARDLPENIKISRGTLEQDIEICHVVLYRGSTAVVKAAMAGLLPINVCLAKEMSIDPIFTVGASRVVVASPEEMAAAIEPLKLLEIKLARVQDVQLQGILDEFYAPLQSAVLVAFHRGGGG